MAMSWEGYSWLLLRACGVNQHQLLSILQPYQGRFPSTEAEFNSMQLTLRRMGHILEQTPGNIASQLRAAPNRAFVTQQSEGSAEPWQSDQPDPWQNPAADPWQASASMPGQAQAAASSSQPAARDAGQGGAYYAPAAEGDSGTDTDTISSLCEPLNYQEEEELRGMTPEQMDAHLFWTYQRAKSRWRRHMQKPVRRARRFIRRKGKGKGRGKGASRFSFLADMDDTEVEETFFGKGKGRGNGKRSSGKGKGRRKVRLDRTAR